MQEYFSNKTIEKLKYDLVRENLLSFEDLTHAEEVSKSQNIHIGQVLINEKFISEEVLLKFLEDNLHIPYVNLDDYSLDKNCIDYISLEDASKYKIIPLFKIEDVLTIAMADPLDLFVINNLIKSVNYSIEPVICSERLISEAINNYYRFSPEEDAAKAMVFDWKDELNSGIVNEFQAEKVINSIVFQAVLEDSHEIIFENTNEGKFVNFKKDGKIEEKGIIPVLLTPLFNSKLKTLSGIDSSINEIPQLGKFYITFENSNIACIAATFPTVKGERLAIKLYKPPETLKELNLNEEEKALLEDNLKKSGIIIISGPNLSGKSYIAYSILNSIDKTDKNIMTVESIAKYDLENVNQCELKEKVGFNFEKAVKFIDFQSPDVIYVEEIVSNEDMKYLSFLADAKKTIITEFTADNPEEVVGRIKTQLKEDFKGNVNCLIFVENKDKIQVISKKGL